jgi:hemerythrin HHE cation binding domain-containing protein
MSIRSTQPFLDEYAQLRDHVEHFPVAARELPTVDRNERIEMVERIVAFLADILLPHCAAEERVLYPAAARLLSEEDTSATVAGDRAKVRDMLAQLSNADPDDPGALQEPLYALYAILSAHFWREEELYLKLVALRDEAGASAILDHVGTRASAS